MIEEIQKQIYKDIDNEFEYIARDIRSFYKEEYDIKKIKKIISQNILSEVIKKGDVLLQNTLNYLMKYAENKIESGSTEFQNRFYDHDFRNIIKEYAADINKKLEDETFRKKLIESTKIDLKNYKPGNIKFSMDPRWYYAGATGVITIVGVGTVTFLLWGNVIGAYAVGLLTLAAAAVVFKIVWEKTKNKSREKFKKDVDMYLEQSKVIIKTWLNDVGDRFIEEFIKFCKENGFIIEE